MALAFKYRLELEDGTPADPPTFRSASGVAWRAGDRIPWGEGHFAWLAFETTTRINRRCWWSKTYLNPTSGP